MSTRKRKRKQKRARRWCLYIGFSGDEVRRYKNAVKAQEMTRVAVQSGLVEFVAQQPAMVQIAILSRYPEEQQKELAEAILRRMAGEG
jgi:hypothetical protein